MPHRHDDAGAGAVTPAARSSAAPPPTLRTIAQAVGVSAQTVSNVLNDPDRVAPTTRERVLAEIERAGYQPSQAARQLRTRRSRLIGFRMRRMTDGINGAITGRLLHGFVESANERGYSILLFTSEDDVQEIEDIKRLRLTAGIDGVLLTQTGHGDTRGEVLRDAGIPAVSFGRPWGREDDPGNPLEWVDVDGSAGTAEAVRTLHEDGARRIGFIGWPMSSSVSEDRLHGFLRAMEDLGLSTDLVERREEGFEEGQDAAVVLVDRGADALVCASDSLALGALAAMRTRSRRDIMRRTVGSDDTPVARSVGLSSIDQPIEDVAEQMVDILVRRIEASTGEQLDPRTRILTPELRRREPL